MKRFLCAQLVASCQLELPSVNGSVRSAECVICTMLCHVESKFVCDLVLEKCIEACPLYRRLFVNYCQTWSIGRGKLLLISIILKVLS